MSRIKDLKMEGYAEQSQMHDLVKQLMKVWSIKSVQQGYQNYFLMYLDLLSQQKAERAIANEIRLTIENKSRYFQIKQALQLHDSVVSRIKIQLFHLEDKQIINQEELEILASMLGQLRQSNLLTAEATLNLCNECISNSRQEPNLIRGNNYIFQKLNLDNKFLRQSILRNYIIFSNSYDPFFLHHYQSIKNTSQFKNTIYPCIQKLFTLSISTTYRLFKVQLEIVQFLSGKLPSKTPLKVNKRHNYRIVDYGRQEQDRVELSNIQRLENEAYVSNRKQSDQQPFQFVRSKTDQYNIKRYVLNSRQPSKIKTMPKQQKKYQLPKLYQNRNYTESSSNSIEIPKNRKLSGLDKNSKFIFKVRRLSMRNAAIQSPYSPYRKRSEEEEEKGSISIINQRQLEFLNSSPIKKSTNKRYKDIKEFPQENQITDSFREKPLQKGLTNQPKQNVTPKQVQTTAINTYSFKNFKLKAANINDTKLFVFLKELPIKGEYRRIFEIGNWQASIKNNQYYMHKFYVSDQLYAISLCCSLPEGDIVIKYWGPLQSCDKEMSNFLFKKYLQHIQKNSTTKKIFYNAPVQINQLFVNNFSKQKQRIYAKQRSNPTEIQSFSYYPFLTINYNSISIDKSAFDSDKQGLNKITLSSNTVTPFTQKQFICFNYLLVINKLNNPGIFSQVGTYSPNLKTMKEVQTKLIKQEFPYNSYNTQSNVSNINLLTIRMKNPIHSAFFIVNKPYIKLIGQQIYEDDESLVVSLQMNKYNTKLYFGKGFKSLNSMIEVIKNRGPSKRLTEYCLRMFSKRMRGRILSVNLRNQYCFGDFEIIFEWIDFLKGKVQHNLSNIQIIGESNFYCVVEIDKENIFGCQVNESNFI